MKKHKRLFAVLLLLLIFVSLAVPAGAVTDFRYWNAGAGYAYSGLGSFSIFSTVNRMGDFLPLGYSYDSVKYGRIEYSADDEYNSYFDYFRDYNSTLYGYNNYDPTFSSINAFWDTYGSGNDAIHYCAARVYESCSLYDPLNVNTNIVYQPFVIDQNIVKNDDFLDYHAISEGTRDFIQFLKFDTSFSFSLTISYDALSLVDGSTYSVNDYTVYYEGTDILPLIDVTWLPDQYITSDGDVPVGPSLPDQDFSIVQITNYTVDVSFIGGDYPGYFDIYDTIIAYNNGNTDSNGNIIYTQSLDLMLNIVRVENDNSGDNNTYLDAYENGYNAGVSAGRQEGYNEGINASSLSFTDWIGTAVGGFFSFELYNGISLGGILIVCIAFGLVFLFLKYFAGG